LRGPLESAQYSSFDYAQVLDDHRVLQSVGSVGDAYDNALAESFLDSFKTELIADRVWRSRSQLELATVEYIGWFNHDRLHSALDYLTPVEYEHRWQRSQHAALRGRRARAPIERTSAPAGLVALRFGTLDRAKKRNKETYKSSLRRTQGSSG